MPRYVQDRSTGKLVEVSRVRTVVPDSPTIVGDIEPFVSPIDRSVITGRRALRDHGKRHGVAQQREYGENEGQEYFRRKELERQQRMTSNTRADREDRARTIARALDEQRRK